MIRVAAAAVLAGALALSPVSAATPVTGIIALPLQPIVPAAQRGCTAKTASGLGYSELRAGTGRKAGASDYVLINYIGYLAATGQAFDQAMTTPMRVGGTIPGFAEGLQLIPTGAVWRLCVPAALGYGAQGAGPVPANADLVFQVEVLDTRTPAEVEAMRQQAAAQPGGAGGAQGEAPAPRP